MPKNLRLSKNLVSEAQSHAVSNGYTVAQQIEYWAKIGKIAEDNPDLTYSFIKDILTAKSELKAKMVSSYKFE